MLKIGIIGLGMISAAHIPNYIKNDRAEIGALCDSDEQWLKKEGARLGVKALYTEYRELLANDSIDAVVVCLPTYLHAQASIDALRAGKHVLCEKPMACSGAEARAMEKAAEETGKLLMISHNQRFGNDIQLLSQLNAEQAFGEIYFMRLGWRRPLGGMPTPYERRPDGTPYNRNWFNEKRRGGGVLRDLGSHLLDLAMFITGFPAFESLSASCYRKFYPEIPEADLKKFTFDSEDLATGHIKFQTGLSIQLEVSFGSMVEKEKLLTEIYGTKAGAFRDDREVRVFRNRAGILSTETITRFPQQVRVPDERFLDCLLEGKANPVPPNEGAMVIELIDQLYASGMRGQ